uniref:Vwaint domain-containing protein n=1 Tax=Anisakis simplex TaxID=6269 RepID=A0A0M3JAC0_ANISI
LQRELLMRSKMSGVQSIDERTITEGSSSLDMQRNEHIKEMNIAEHRPAQALTAFESARASFMSASERAARYSLGGANTSSLSAYNNTYEKPTNYQHHHQKTNSADDNHNNSVLLPSSSSTPFYNNNNNNNVNDPTKKPTTPRIIRPAPPPPPLAQTGLKLKPPIPVPRKPGTSGETNQVRFVSF